MNEPRVAIVILAAGTSSRLGRPKQLLELDGEPLIRWTVRHAIAARAHEAVLVVGSRGDEIALAAGDCGQRTVLNPDFAHGQSTSMVAGIQALGDHADAVIMMLGDQPTVRPSLLNRLIERFGEDQPAIVQPRYSDGPGNPVLFAARMFPELLDVKGDLGAREVIKRHRSDVVFVDIDSPAPPDVDSDADYERLRGNWKPDQG